MSLTQRTQGQKDPMDPENQNLKDLKDPEGYPERIPRGPKKDQHTNLLQIDGSAGSRPGNHQLYHSSIQRREDKKEMKINTEKRD